MPNKDSKAYFWQRLPGRPASTVAESTQFSELQKQNEYLAALQDTTVGLVEHMDLTDVLEQIVSRAAGLAETHSGYVFLLDPETHEMVMRVGVGAYEGFVGTKAQPGVGLAGQVWQMGAPLVVDDYRTWGGRLQDTSRDILRAVAGIPIKQKARGNAGNGKATETIIGVLGLAYLDESHHFSPTEVDALTRFAALAAVALDNAELNESAQRELAQRREAEKTLAYERDLLQAIMDNIPDLIFFKDRESRFVRSNAAHLKNLGAQKMDEVFGKTDLDYHDSEAARQFMQDEHKIIETGVPLLNQLESNPAADGTQRYFATSKVPWRDQDGQIIGTLGVAHDVTERVLAEQKLSNEMAERLRAEQFLDSVVENLPTMLFVKDAQDLRFVRWNKAGEEMTGRSRQEFIGKSDADFFSPEETAFFVAKDRETLNSGKVLDIPEEPLETASGEVRWLHTKKFPVMGADGKPEYLVGISEDITERKRAETQLRESEAELAEALRLAHLSNWEYDVATDTFTFNDQFYAVLRTTVEREGGYAMTSGQYAQRFVYPEDLPMVGIEVQNAIQTTDPNYTRQLDHRVVYPDGEIGYVSVQIRVRKDSSGRTVQTYGANLDITERKRTETQLRESEERYRDLFENANDLIQSVNADGHFAYVNETWRQVLGYADEELKNLTFLDIIHPDERQHCLQLFGRVMAGEAVPDISTAFVTKDGRKLFIEGSTTPRLQDGKVISTRGIYRDVTERRRGQEREIYQNALITAQYNASPDGILVVGSDDQILSNNARFAEMWGIPAEAVATGKADAMRLAIQNNLADPDAWRRQTAEIYKNRETQNHDEIGFKDGRVFERFSTPIKSDDGEYLGRVWFFHDVTASRRSEADLDQERYLLNTLMENLPHAVYIKDESSRFIRVNRAALERFGLRSPAEALGKTDADIFTEEHARPALEDEKRILETGVPIINKEEKETFPDGTVLWSSTTKMPIYSPGSAGATGTFGISIDVTERRQAEEAMRQQNAYLNALQETSLALMSRLDVNALLQDIVTNAGSLVGTNSGYVYLRDPDSDEMELRVGVGAYEGFVGRRTQPGVGLAGQVWETNKPVAVDDYRQWGGRLADASRDILRAVAGVPLRSGSEVIGVIGLAYLDDASKFGPAQIEILERFAQLAALALDNARLYETAQQELGERTRAEQETRNRNKELEVISRVSAAMTENLDMVTALETLAKELVQVFQARNCGIALLNPERTELTVVADALSEEHEEHAVGIVIPLENNESSQYVVNNKRSLVIPNAQTDPMTEPIHERMIQRHTQCLAIIPLLSAGEVIGTIGLDTTDPDHLFSDQEIRLAETMANQMANAIEKQRLFDLTRKSLAETQTLYDISAQMNAATTLNQVVKTTAKAGLQNNARSVLLALVARDTDGAPLGFRLVDQVTPGADTQMPLGSLFPNAQFRVGHVLFENPNQPLFLGNVDTDTRLDPATRELLQPFGAQASIFLPLAREDQLLGMFMLNWADAQAFTAAERQFYATLGSQASLALNNRLLFQETQQALAETQTLYRVGTRLNSASNLQEALEAAAAPALAEGAMLAALFEMNLDAANEPHTLTLQASIGPAAPRAIPVGTVLPVVGSAFSNEWTNDPTEPVMVGDIENDARLTETERANFRLSRVRATAILPLNISGRWIGLMGLNWATPRTFSEQERQLFRSIMTQAATVLENRRLFEQTQQALAETQTLYEISARLNAATSLQEALESASGPAIVQGATNTNLMRVFTDVAGEVAGLEIAAVWPRNADNAPGAGTQVPSDLLGDLTGWLTDPSEPGVVEDVDTDPTLTPGVRAMFQARHVKSMAHLPLRVAERWVGILTFTWDEPHHFSANELRVYRAVMAQAATVLDNRQLFEQTQQALATTENLFQASQRLTQANTLQELVAAVVESVKIDVVNRAILFSIQRDAEGEMSSMTVAANWHSGSGPLPTPVGTIYPRTVFAAVPIILSATAKYVDDVQHSEELDPASRAMFIRQEISSAAVLPLWIGTTQRGAMLLETQEPHAFTENETRAYLSLAPQLAIAIENRRLFDETQTALGQTRTALNQVEQAQRHLNLQYQTANLLAEATSFNEVMPQLLEVSSKAFDWQIGEYWEIDESANRLVLAHLWHREDEALNEFGDYSRGLTFEPGEGLAGRAWAEGKPIWSPTIATDAGFVHADKAERTGLVSALAFPLASEAHTFGVITFLGTQPQGIDETTIDTMRGVGSQIGQFLERRRAEEAVRQQNTYLTALHDTTLGLMRRIDLEELLQNILTRAGELIGTEHGYVHLVDPGLNELQMRVGTGIYQEFVGTRVKAGQGLAGTVWRDDKPIVVDDYHKWAGRLPNVDRDVLRAVIGVPLKSGDQTVGVLGLASLEEGRRFDATQIEALKRFAELASVAMDNAQLHSATQLALERTQRVARREKEGAEIADKLYAAPDVNAVLRTAAEELRRSTGSRRAVVRLQLGTNGKANGDGDGHNGKTHGNGDSHAAETHSNGDAGKTEL